MDLAIAFILGGACGWLAGRFLGGSAERSPRGFRPNKRQRKILATLPPDPERPTLEQLVREEATELGVDRIPGADHVPLGIRLKVWKRDHASAGPCDSGEWRYAVQAPQPGEPITADHLRLECRPRDEVPAPSGNTGE